MTVPGMPDFFQGTEFWDFSLVDPDNRRPVDYSQRIALLEKLDLRGPNELLKHWQDGGIKMRATHALLHCRQAFPELFTLGEYTPLQPEGIHAERIVAFMRSYKSVKLVVIAPRSLGMADTDFLGKTWQDTRLSLPESDGWRNILIDRAVTPCDGGISLDLALAEWPVSVLISL